MLVYIKIIFNFLTCGHFLYLFFSSELYLPTIFLQKKKGIMQSMTSLGIVQSVCVLALSHVLNHAKQCCDDAFTWSFVL